MRNAKIKGLLDTVLKETIEMDSRMIHGRRSNGALFQESQVYDINGRVGYLPLLARLRVLMNPSISKQQIEQL